MDLIQLTKMGAFIPKGLVKKEIAFKHPTELPKDQWQDPEVAEYDEETMTDATMTAYIKRRSSADLIEIMNTKDRDKMYATVLLSVMKEDGEPVFESIDQVRLLKEWIFIPVLLAVNEVNSTKKKNSQQKKSSGAKSRSPSEAVALRNGSNTSAKKSAESGSSTDQSAGHTTHS